MEPLRPAWEARPLLQPVVDLCVIELAQPETLPVPLTVVAPTSGDYFVGDTPLRSPKLNASSRFLTVPHGSSFMFIQFTVCFYWAISSGSYKILTS